MTRLRSVARADSGDDLRARVLGLTRPQIAYRLKRLHEADPAAGEAPPALLRP